MPKLVKIPECAANFYVSRISEKTLWALGGGKCE